MGIAILLPSLRVSVSCEQDEDLFFAFSVADPSGFPVDLTGVTFTANISLFGVLIATLSGVVAGSNNQAVLFVALAADKAFLGCGRYEFEVVATDGLFTRDVFSKSTLHIGKPAGFKQLRSPNGVGDLAVTIITPGIALSTPQETLEAILALPTQQLTALGTAIAPLLGIWSPPSAVQSLGGNATISQPGIYALTAQNLTIGLPSSWAFSQGVVIVDATEATGNPGHTIGGPINGYTNQEPLLLTQAGQSASFVWSSTLSAWIDITASMPSNATLAAGFALLPKTNKASLLQSLIGSVPNVQNGDAIPSAGNLFINSDGLPAIAQP